MISIYCGLKLLGALCSKSSIPPCFLLPPPSVIGRPLFLLPSGLHPRATAQSSAGSFLNMWPIQFHLLLLISPLVLVVSTISSTVRFDKCCCHLILRILHKHFVWRELIFFSFFSSVAVYSVWVSMSHIHITIQRGLGF